jgi:hypothetical protein
MELYVLKTKNGYVKSTDPENPTLVGIEKASVYPTGDSELIQNLAVILRERGEEELRMAKLEIREVDYYKKI